MRIAFVYPDRAKRWPKFEWAREAAARLGHDTRAVRTAGDLREADAWAEVVLFEHRDTPEWDVLLWGCVRGYRQRKGDVRALIDAGFRVAWAGHPSGVLPQGVEPLPWCEPLDLPALASRAAVVLGVSARNDIDGYWSDRFWLALGMGACLVHRATPGLPRHSPACYAVYRDEAELIDVVAELRSDRITRQWAGDIARRWVMDNHTYEHRVCEVLNHDGT